MHVLTDYNAINEYIGCLKDIETFEMCFFFYLIWKCLKRMTHKIHAINTFNIFYFFIC